MGEKVEFKRGLRSDYDLLANKSKNIFYYCEDTCELFLGDKLITISPSQIIDGAISGKKVIKAWSNSDYTGTCYYVVTDLDNGWVKYGDLVYYDEELTLGFGSAKFPLANQITVNNVILYYNINDDYSDKIKIRYLASDEKLVTEKSVVEFVHDNHTEIRGGDDKYLILSKIKDLDKNNYTIDLNSVDKEGLAKSDIEIATIKSIKTLTKDYITKELIENIQNENVKVGDVVIFDTDKGIPQLSEQIGNNFKTISWEAYVQEYEQNFETAYEKYKYPMGLVLDPVKRTFLYAKIFNPGRAMYGGTSSVISPYLTSIDDGKQTDERIQMLWNTPSYSGAGNHVNYFPIFYELHENQLPVTQMTSGTPPGNIFYLQKTTNYISSIGEIEKCMEDTRIIKPTDEYTILNRQLSRMEYMLGLNKGFKLTDTVDNFPVYLPADELNVVSSTMPGPRNNLFCMYNRFNSVDGMLVNSSYYHLVIGLY